MRYCCLFDHQVGDVVAKWDGGAQPGAVTWVVDLHDHFDPALDRGFMSSIEEVR